MKRAPILKAAILMAFFISYFSSKAQNLEANTVKRDSVTIQFVKPHALYLEVGGPGLALTINYDTRFGNNSDKLGYRIGTGYYNTGANSVFTVPFQVNYLIGGGGSYLEVGAGTTFVYSKGSINGVTFEFDNVTGFIGTASLGYRYQQENGGINFRIAFVPILYDEGVIAAGGVSIGYTF